jgi:predicted glycoside hydrolase/deacetylase ChbG (UPF0249 family)
MKYIIVNADDLGADIDRNRGIGEAVAAGAVTSVSVLVNGPATADALTRLRAWRGVSVGIHVNLSEGRPLLPDLVALPAGSGLFRGKSKTHKLLMQKDNSLLEGEAAREIAAQISLLAAHCRGISHLDGHQHVHVFPAVIGAAVRAARKAGIPWLRIPAEEAPPSTPPHLPGPEGTPADLAGPPLAEAAKGEAARFRRVAKAARPFLEGSGVGATAHFRGLYLVGRLSLDLLAEILDDLPPGLTELMVHPGRAPAAPGEGPFASFSTGDRERELEVLLDPMFPKLLKEKGVVLTSFPEARR